MHGQLAVNSDVLDGGRMHVLQMVPFTKMYNTYREEQLINKILRQCRIMISTMPST